MYLTSRCVTEHKQLSAMHEEPIEVDVRNILKRTQQNQIIWTNYLSTNKINGCQFLRDNSTSSTKPLAEINDGRR